MQDSAISLSTNYEKKDSTIMKEPKKTFDRLAIKKLPNALCKNVAAKPKMWQEAGVSLMVIFVVVIVTLYVLQSGSALEKGK